MIAFGLGVLFATGALSLWFFLRQGSFRRMAGVIIEEAEKRARDLAKSREEQTDSLITSRMRALEEKMWREQKRLAKEDERLAGRERQLREREETAASEMATMEQREEAILEKERLLLALWEEKSGLTAKRAEECLIERARKEREEEIATLREQAIDQAMADIDLQAKRVLLEAMQRLAIPCVNEATITTVALPNEQMKGRVIGREGRNIHAFEHETGVTVIIDESPESVTLSSFDPIRREVARIALENLIRDGRIHPTRIGELVLAAKQQITQEILRRGEAACCEVGVSDLDPKLIGALGKLFFHRSLGQNTLQHTVEVAKLMGIMAAEIDLDVALAVRIGLLHDVGKGIDSKEGIPHAELGAHLARTCGEKTSVVEGIAFHHGKTHPSTLEATLLPIADTLSAARPGGRSESLNHYFTRLEELEQLALTFPGVIRARVFQAGREMIVTVAPEKVDEGETAPLARSLIKKIEQKMSFPGKIKVSVVRETRAVDYALDF